MDIGLIKGNQMAQLHMTGVEARSLQPALAPLLPAEHRMIFAELVEANDPSRQAPTPPEGFTPATSDDIAAHLELAAADEAALQNIKVELPVGRLGELRDSIATEVGRVLIDNGKLDVYKPALSVSLNHLIGAGAQVQRTLAEHVDISM